MLEFFQKGQSLLGRRQGSILSAAFVILIFVAISRVLGVVRLSVFTQFFTTEEIAIYQAAFRIPETLFEILVSGSLSSAFIPIFTSVLGQGDRKRAWYIAGITQTTIFSLYLLFSILIFLFANPLTSLLTPGWPQDDQNLAASVTRALLVVQVFFLLSFFMSAIQESFQRFIVPAIAPLFYNLGIILGVVFFHDFGIWGMVYGAIAGSFVQFVIQLPFTRQLGFRFIPKIDFVNRDFQGVVKLALPRLLEVAVAQVAKSVELFLSTLISFSPYSYTYLTFANTLQLFPVALFGYSIGKAAFPTLSQYAARNQGKEFAETFVFSLGQALFFVIPAAVVVAVLRIPLVRLFFGRDLFGWEATVQTSFVLSAFALGIVALTVVGMLARSFYAFKDTKTPMLVAIVSLILNITLSFIFILVLKLPVWGLALSYSIATTIQAIALSVILNTRVAFVSRNFVFDMGKILLSAFCSGFVMYFLLKIFDQAVWDKRLAFLGDIGLALPTTFQLFVLDTRYTVNLVFLTLLVITVGMLVYIVIATLLRCREVELLARWIGKLVEREVELPATRAAEGKSELPPPLPPGG